MRSASSKPRVLFSQLVANYGDPHLRDKYNQDVDNAERAADRVTHDVNKAIHKTFITPIDRGADPRAHQHHGRCG